MIHCLAMSPEPHILKFLQCHLADSNIIKSMCHTHSTNHTLDLWHFCCRYFLNSLIRAHFNKAID